MKLELKSLHKPFSETIVHFKNVAESTIPMLFVTGMVVLTPIVNSNLQVNRNLETSNVETSQTISRQVKETKIIDQYSEQRLESLAKFGIFDRALGKVRKATIGDVKNYIEENQIRNRNYLRYELNRRGVSDEDIKAGNQLGVRINTMLATHSSFSGKLALIKKMSYFEGLSEIDVKDLIMSMIIHGYSFEDMNELGADNVQSLISNKITKSSLAKLGKKVSLDSILYGLNELRFDYSIMKSYIDSSYSSEALSNFLSKPEVKKIPFQIIEGDGSLSGALKRIGFDLNKISQMGFKNYNDFAKKHIPALVDPRFVKLNQELEILIEEDKPFLDLPQSTVSTEDVSINQIAQIQEGIRIEIEEEKVYAPIPMPVTPKVTYNDDIPFNPIPLAPLGLLPFMAYSRRRLNEQFKGYNISINNGEVILESSRTYEVEIPTIESLKSPVINGNNILANQQAYKSIVLGEEQGEKEHTQMDYLIGAGIVKVPANTYVPEVALETAVNAISTNASNLNVKVATTPVVKDEVKPLKRDYLMLGTTPKPQSPVVSPVELAQSPVEESKFFEQNIANDNGGLVKMFREMPIKKKGLVAAALIAATITGAAITATLPSNVFGSNEVGRIEQNYARTNGMMNVPYGPCGNVEKVQKASIQ